MELRQVVQRCTKKKKSEARALLPDGVVHFTCCLRYGVKKFNCCWTPLPYNKFSTGIVRNGTNLERLCIILAAYEILSYFIGLKILRNFRLLRRFQRLSMKVLTFSFSRKTRRNKIVSALKTHFESKCALEKENFVIFEFLLRLY